MVQELEATVFTTLPEELHYRGAPTAWAQAVRPGKRMHSFLEGPSFDRDGNLYVTDVPHGRIFRVNSAGEWDTALEYDGQPNGLAIHRDGRLFVADHQLGLVVIDPVSGDLSLLCENHTFRGCSDLVFRSNGDLYFTDAGTTSLSDPSGRVYRWSEGGLETVLTGIPYPNGLVFDEDESQLLLAVTRGNCVWKFAANTSGSNVMAGLFIQLSGGLGPDGLALDVDGRLAVAHARHGTVWIFDRDGEPVYRIRTAGKSVTNVAYGGTDNKTLYITEADNGSILQVELDTPGQLLFSHQ